MDGAQESKDIKKERPIGFGHKTSPEERANILSKLTFWWATRLPIFAKKHVLQLEHLWEVTRVDKAGSVYNEVEKQWQHQLTLPQPAFGRALWDTYKFYYLRCFFFMLLSIGAQMSQPELLARLTEWVTEKHYGIPHDNNSGYLYAMGMFLVATFGSICTYQANYNGIRAGSSLRSAVVVNVYRKALKLSNGAKNKTSQGNIVNLMSNDAQRLVDTSIFLNNVIAAPVQVVASIILLYFKIGWPTFVALGFMICCMPINGYTAKRMGAFRWGMVMKSDLRVKVTTEIIQFIKVIKLYAWEDSFAQKVITARMAEIAHLRSFNKVRSLLISVITSVPVVSAVLMYCAYWGSGNELTASVVFSSLSYLNSLALPFNFIPLLAALIVQMKVATTRVTEFMLLEEMSNISELTNEPVPTIKINDADFDWDVPKDDSAKGKEGAEKAAENETKGEEGKEAKEGTEGKEEEGKDKGGKGKGKKKKGPPGAKPPGFGGGPPGMGGEKKKRYPDFTLRNVNMNFTGPQLIAVVGAVGSGKSSLCNSILGEMKLLKGNVGKHGRIAYVPQQAWIINATLRENILFGCAFDEKRYEAVLEACALAPDLKILSAGDMTEIGERGINLSGGQKQRVSIARALYNDADIYVLDDPLSAVDAHVAKHLFYQCIRKYLSGKLVILATNQLQFLPDTDQVIFLGGDGHTAGQGKFTDIMASNSQFSEMMHIAGGGSKAEEKEEEEAEKKEETKPEATADTPADGKLVIKEDRESGSVGWEVYYEYLRNGGLVKAFLIFLVYCAAVGSNTFLNWWLSHWTSDEPTSNRPSYFYFTIYIGIAAFYVIVSAIRAFSFFDYVTTAALNLHNGLFNRIIRAPMWFFDVTPLGRIINRFSKDIDQLDNMLHMTMDQTINFSLQLLAAIIMISILIPIILAVVAPCVLIYALLQNFYRHTSRELQRIESISRSPIFTQFSETLSGTSSIRAYACTERMITTNQNLLDNNLKAFYTLQAMNQWLGVRLDFLGNIIVFGTAIFVIVFEGNITPAEAGLALSYALQLTNFLNRATLMSADFETKMNSVERIMYSSNGPVEHTSDPAQDEPKWPSTGEIEFNNYKMRYREGLDLVLRGISCSISTNEKIGIVGRTGAGKSSIVLALFRLVEAAEGNIVLDHTDISQVALKTLRSKIAIIPQDPVLFSGTVRENLDPFFTLHDNDIWKVLEHIQLKEAVEKAGGLQATVSENGENWSVGQRQLICLCRALLRKPKILVLDEATASVDSYTDALIQRTIRSEFSDATILTIAHRLNTIMDSTRIIVMDKGTIAEFDTPARLIDNPQSHLNWLVDQTGPKSAELLRNIAYGRATVV